MSGAEQILGGLLTQSKTLPTWLLYDEVGCGLYERITELPEYYLARSEAAILAQAGEAILSHVSADCARVSVAELGAGTAKKTEPLVALALERQRHCTYLACDIAPEPLEVARARMCARYPRLELRTFVGTHVEAGPALGSLEDRQVLLFVGSSIGNYSDDDAVALLATVRESLRDDAFLVLGTDLEKEPRRLEAAYDDGAGVTAAFTSNVLVRLNRELSCDFDVAAFRHVATWNAVTSNVEIALEAKRSMSVRLGAVGRETRIQQGERIQLEICAKYDEARIDGILGRAGFTREASFLDASGSYAVQVARATPVRQSALTH